MIFSLEQIKKAMNKKGYSWFDGNKDYNLNIIGVRCNKDYSITNQFDDILILAYKENGSWVYKEYPITTDAGLKSMKDPINVKGCAILAAGQYKGAYALGLHKGKEALVQVKPVKVYRDKNKDGKYDYGPNTIDEGMFGINIHRAGQDSIIVDGWSAGCQVCKRIKDCEDIIRIAKESVKYFKNSFTYTLLELKDI